MNWISVKERLPRDMQTVIIPGGAGYRVGLKWFTCISMDGPRQITWEVKHWMPLPESPWVVDEDLNREPPIEVDGATYHLKKFPPGWMDAI